VPLGLFRKRKRLTRRERLEERYLKEANPLYLLPLSGLCLKEGLFDKAEEYCELFVEAYPDDIGGLYLLAQIKEARDDVEGAIQILEDLRVRFPCALGARKRLGRLYSRAGRDDEAIEEYLFILGEFRDSHLKRLVERRSRKAKRLGVPAASTEPQPEEVVVDDAAEDDDLPVINLDEEIEIPEDADTAEDVDEEFLTVEMADLYYKQGLIAQAVDVLEKLYLKNPEDEEVKSRLEKLRPLADMLEPEEP
jgi:tetratricopeptide (TPR) repeat protein